MSLCPTFLPPFQQDSPLSTTLPWYPWQPQQLTGVCTLLTTSLARFPFPLPRYFVYTHTQLILLSRFPQVSVTCFPSMPTFSNNCVLYIHCIYTPGEAHCACTCFNERWRRKEERSKQGQTNNKAKQHSTCTYPLLHTCIYMYIIRVCVGVQRVGYLIKSKDNVGLLYMYIYIHVLY